jgi:hypothetical protein
MAESIKLTKMLVDAGVLPPEMPQNYTYGKVREVLGDIGDREEVRAREALSALSRLEIAGPLQSALFIKHHLAGEHETSVDRVIDDVETGEKYAVLTYPEGELPVKLKNLPRGTRGGRRLRYDPAACRFNAAGGGGDKTGRHRRRGKK